MNRRRTLAISRLWPTPFVLLSILLAIDSLYSQVSEPLSPPKLTEKDVFDLEYASDPQISPDAKRLVYVRRFADIMTDRFRSHLWTVSVDGSQHRPLVTGSGQYSSPRWSPKGDRIAFIRTENGDSEIGMVYTDTGQVATISRLPQSPSGLLWHPEGRALVFSMLVPELPKPMVSLPPKPQGATWAEPARVVTRLGFRGDGQGFLPHGYRHFFRLSDVGGTPQQLTTGSFHHRNPGAFSPDGQTLYFSANRSETWELDGRESEIYALDMDSLDVKTLTDRQGPDFSPTISPDGEWIAYLGHDDQRQGYAVNHLHLMKSDGTEKQELRRGLDRNIQSPTFVGSDRIAFQFDDKGKTKVAWTNLGSEEISIVCDDVGGTTLGRPYASGSYHAIDDGTLAYTMTSPSSPSDVVVINHEGESRQVTRLNDDLLSKRSLGKVWEIWFESQFDQRPIQGWIVYPPDYDSEKSYPLILEIHGGPFANYGNRFSMEVQLFAAKGYVVLYTNPRGSTSYGEEFGNLIHHAYPSQDYDDLLSGVDAVIEKLGQDSSGIDKDRLYVTGGSGGGVLTSWIIGHTDRFCAAVVAKPVINWASFALTADMVASAIQYWFPGPPWEFPEHYLQRSPIHYVGKVKTPTMMLTGEDDFRTPMGETEQFYNALKFRGVETVMVRIPGASHGIASRPSRLISKVLHILQWFEDHQP